jgi:hypothetical protein
VQIRAHAVTALVGLALIASACGGETATTTTGATGNPSGPVTGGATGAQGSTGQPAATPEILDFEAPLLGGGTLRGADYAGKDVAFWFWAPW